MHSPYFIRNLYNTNGHKLCAHEPDTYSLDFDGYGTASFSLCIGLEWFADVCSSVSGDLHAAAAAEAATGARKSSTQQRLEPIESRRRWAFPFGRLAAVDPMASPIS